MQVVGRNDFSSVHAGTKVAYFRRILIQTHQHIVQFEVRVDNAHLLKSLQAVSDLKSVVRHGRESKACVNRVNLERLPQILLHQLEHHTVMPVVVESVNIIYFDKISIKEYKQIKKTIKSNVE